MPAQSKHTPTEREQLRVADKAIVVAQAALWLAQVEAVCLRTCHPAHCRVRDSLMSSLDADQAELAVLQSQVVVVDLVDGDYQAAVA